MKDRGTPIVSVKNVSKSFSGVTVLKNIDFDLYPGEVHALLGENGAGKTTLVKIISGVFPPTKGEIYFKGKKTAINNPHAAREMGIALIHQEPLTFPDLNVTENIFVGHTKEGKSPTIDWKKKRERARELLKSLGVNMDERALVKGMSIADQQMVEITSALSQNAEVIIMDEPTAALSLGEVETLFKIIKKLKKQGKAIVFIGHRLEEIEVVSDRITVLRDGEKVGEMQTEGTKKEQMVQMMIGRSVNEQIHKENNKIGEPLLKLEKGYVLGKFKDISIEVKRGEIVGMAGLVGAGRTEVAEAIFGLDPLQKGKLFYKGKRVKITNPKQAIDKGMALVPEDRAKAGLLLPFTIQKNVTFAILKKIAKFGWIKVKKEKQHVEDYIQKLDIKLRDMKQEAQELSGGNQQKVVLSKWLLTTPDLLILDEPTRGIDVGAKAEVYKLINSLAQQGKGILMISSELPEIMALSDKVYVMCEGRLTGEFERKELVEDKIMTAASSSLHVKEVASK